jgi:glutamine synthetase
MRAYLPRTLGEAIAEAKKDQFIRQSLGAPLFDEYVKTRDSEWKAYREQVTEWEVANYLTTF